jgi:hypothetical protein
MSGSSSRSSGGGKASLPWSVKGVTHTARDLAKTQAQDTDATMGQWLSGVVRRVGAAEASGKALVPMAALNKPDGAESKPMGAAAEAEPIDERELVEMVSERILATEERLVGLLGNLEDIILSLGERLERLETRIEAEVDPVRLPPSEDAMDDQNRSADRTGARDPAG